MESSPYSYDSSPNQHPHPPVYAPEAYRSRLPRLIGVLIILTIVWFLPTYLQRISYSQKQGEIRAIRESLTDLDLKRASLAFSIVPQLIGPSVVHINTESNGGYQGYRQGQGSGVIVDTDGYIVTNNHVIEGAQVAKVSLSDGREFSAELIGRDPQNDLAVLKIKAPGLVAAEWGDSDNVSVGELVWAVGNPFGLDRSVTFGIISAKDRSGFGNPDQTFLQTDAAINPGNSGGPLVDIEGKVIGINTAIIGESFAGVGFAIPSALARQKYEQIRAGGTPETAKRAGFVGLSSLTVNPRIARDFNLPTDSGAFITHVMPGGAADEAGILAYDTIVRWGDAEIKTAADLVLRVSRSEVGAVVEVGIIRNGIEQTLQITVGQRLDPGP